jgi:hypothetical protein
MTSAVLEPPTQRAKLPDETGEPETCAACDAYGQPGVRENGQHRDPRGPITENQRCPICKAIVCNRHLEPLDLPEQHELEDHGMPREM